MGPAEDPRGCLALSQGSTKHGVGLVFEITSIPCRRRHASPGSTPPAGSHRPPTRCRPPRPRPPPAPRHPPPVAPLPAPPQADLTVIPVPGNAPEDVVVDADGHI